MKRKERNDRAAPVKIEVGEEDEAEEEENKKKGKKKKTKGGECRKAKRRQCR